MKRVECHVKLEVLEGGKEQEALTGVVSIDFAEGGHRGFGGLPLSPLNNTRIRLLIKPSANRACACSQWPSVFW